MNAARTGMADLKRSGGVDPLGLFRRFENANPIFKRELTQAARLTRTPWILLALTLTIAFVMCATGGITSDTTSPGEVGEILFHTFFSIAAAVVAIAGPSLSANAIAAEREGRTWEALTLTGMPVNRIVRGKFLASFAGIALYIVVLAPVGALCSIFGGVTATELALAFGLLLAFAALSVAFGLAMSSLMHSSRAAILVTLFGAIFLAPFLYLVLGVGGSVLSAHVVGGFKEGAPIWVPLAIARGSFSLSYVLLAIVAPLASLLLPAWFLYELSVSNLENVNGDRASRMKVWFFSTSFVVAGIAAAIPFATPERSRLPMGVLTEVGVALYLLCAPLLFSGETDEPSKLLQARWDQQKASATRRSLGPGHLRAQAMAALVSTVVWSVTVGMASAAVTTESHDASILIAGAYFVPFMMFHAALCTYWRARSQNPWIARVGSVVVGLVLTAVPWVFVAMAGVSHAGNDWLVFGAPSPAYAALLVDMARNTYKYSEARELLGVVGVLTSAAYVVAAIGLTMMANAATRATAARKRAAEAANEAALASG